MSSPRRHPQDHERVRDAERSRAALLESAQSEFAEHGYAGARVTAIARRAGLNKQLISYYFGGKQGLYDAIIDKREALAREFDSPGTTLPDLVVRYFNAFQEQRDQQRIFLREIFDQDPAEVAYEPHNADVAGLAARQRLGEIGADLDPAFVLLFLQAMGVSSAVFPRDVKRLTGLDPQSPEFRNRATDQLRKIVERLA